MKTQAKPGVSAKRESWTAGVKAVREDPEARFKLACGHLPQKQAFREAAVALRALIREHCDDRGAVERYLAVLYRFAGLEALVYSRSSDHGEDGDAADETLAQRWARMAEVSIPYAEVGSASLSLLTRTDEKLMGQLWGEPEVTTTPRAWFDAQAPDPAGSTGMVTDSDAPLGASHHRRATDVEPSVASADPEEAAASPQDKPERTLAEVLAEEARDAEDAVFRLMDQKRVGDDTGRRPADRLVGWASGLKDAFGL